MTLPLILARDRDAELRELDLRSVVSEPPQAEAVCDRIALTGALSEARAEALRYVAEAKAALRDLDLPSAAARRSTSWPTGWWSGTPEALRGPRGGWRPLEGADEAVDLLVEALAGCSRGHSRLPEIFVDFGHPDELRCSPGQRPGCAPRQPLLAG